MPLSRESWEKGGGVMHVFWGLLLAIALILTPHGAFADWQYAKWGMTADQVAKASKGKAIPYVYEGVMSADQKAAEEKSPYATKLKATFKSGSLSLEAHFGFRKDDGMLAYVSVSGDASTCKPLYDALLNKYEKPIDTQRSQFLEEDTWHDKKNNNKVKWTNAGGEVCWIEYSPLSNAENSGL
jgi:hypothetical protein